MRQLPVIGLLLLIPANAVSAAHFHVRSATYACVDPKAALAPNNAALRAGGRCFKVRPTQRLEEIWRPSHSLVMLRVKPPRAGEPPLYFRSSSVVPLRSHRGGHVERGWHKGIRAAWMHKVGVHEAGAHRGGTHMVAARAGGAPRVVANGFGAPEVFDLPSAMIAAALPLAPAAAALAMPPASLFEARLMPAPTPIQAASTTAASGAAPASRVESSSATTDAASKMGAGTTAVRPAAAMRGPGRFNHFFATLLLWALIVAGAVLLVRIALLRRPRPAEAADAPLREPTWSGSSIWPEPPAEPLVSRLPVGAGPGDPGIQMGQGVPQSVQARPLYGAPAGAVGYASSYAIGPAASVASDGGGHAEPGPDGELRDDEQPAELSAYKNRCVAGLRHAGWDARTRFSAGVPGPDVIARSGGLVLALRCLPSADPVDVEAVEDACLVRERQRSDLAAIVSNAAFTDAARQLAARTGIVLLHENELSSFAA